MNLNEIKQVAWIGDEFLKGKIKGVVLVLHGLGNCAMKTEPTVNDLAFGKAGGLVVFPYYGPWSWMNREARVFVDKLVSDVYKAYKIPPNVPLVVVGGSMGGLSALLYARYAVKVPAACAVNCPVCDTEYSYNERPDVPRTILAAFRGYNEPLETLLAEHSPIKQIQNMPDIPYFFIHGEEDTAVSKKHHSDKMVPLMKKRKLKVEYIEVPQMGHCGPLPIEVMEREIGFVLKYLKQK